MTGAVRGRPRKFAEFDAFYRSLPKVMGKRPHYLKGIGVFRGTRGDTAWVKISLPNGAVYDGKSYPPGNSLEMKVGRLSSWPWDRLVEKHAELQGKADRNEPLQSESPITFQDWAGEWSKRAKTRIAKSFETADIHLRVHLLPAFGAKALNTITVSDVNSWIAARLSIAAPATVKREIATLSTILSDAVRAGRLPSNPCRTAEPIRGIRGRQRFLDGAELTRLLAVASERCEWLPDYILWAVHSGMRKAEIERLTWQDVRVLDARRTIVQIPVTKSDQSRVVVATVAMKDVLKRQQRRQRTGDLRVFPVAPITLRRRWEDARHAAGLDDVTLHDLRRTHSTHAVAAGVDLRTLAERLGHANLSMLQKHYAAVVGSTASEAADTIQRTFERLIR